MQGSLRLRKPTGAESKWMSKLLVLDDNFEMLMALRAMVGVMGHSVRSSSSPLEALVMVEKESFDLVICDFLMPELNGDVFLVKAREAGFTGSFIMVTAFPNMLDSSRLKPHDVTAILFKPFRAEAMRDAIDKALGQNIAPNIAPNIGP